MRKILTNITFLFILFLVLFPAKQNHSQVQRNPVIEACTGTWCQWCPCGHTTIDQILIDMPNAIAIEYHGPANGSDPFSFFPGNQIIGLLGMSGYPTGVIDRTSAPQSRTAWTGLMNQRYSVPAPVSITVDKSYNKITRELDVNIHSVAETNLTGEYKLSFLILESGIVYPQTGNASCPGGTNYVHNHLVRAMINGALGDPLNGTAPWNAGDTLSKRILYSVPASFVADNCELVAFVYKVGATLNTSEIQQGEKWPLISPDYVVTVTSTNPDVISNNISVTQFTTSIVNEGLLDDTYYVEASIDGPSGWSGEFTTTNGTFAFGETDSIDVMVNNTADVLVSVNPNGFDGVGEILVQFTSKNDPGIIAISTVRIVTTTGVDMLIVDASGEGYGAFMESSLDKFYNGSYGIIAREALESPDADLSNFYLVAWVAGNEFPVFQNEEVNLLEGLLDNGGRLFITGQNIGKDIFDASGQSQFAQSFYNNYLHATYVNDFGGSFFITGVAGDPIGNGQAFALNNVYDRSPDQIAPFNSNATPVLQFGGGPNRAALKAETQDYRVVYFALGLEQIDSEAIRDTLVSRTLNWLMDGVVVGVDENKPVIVNTFSLDQNYPNPFNPSTLISYSVGEEVQVNLKVYDIMGAEVAELVNRKQSPGNYQLQFDASGLSSGIYLYKLSAGEFLSVKKMTLIK